jgi:hypothetical protein
MVVELLLNLCWLALLLPAFLLWQRRNPSDRSTRRSLLFACTLACLLVLLFPFISASDDLHAGAQAIEESKRTLHGSHGAGSLSVHTIVSFSFSAMPAASAWQVPLERAGTVLEFSPHSVGTFAAVPWIGRAPPV